MTGVGGSRKIILQFLYIDYINKDGEDSHMLFVEEASTSLLSFAAGFAKILNEKIGYRPETKPYEI